MLMRSSPESKEVVSSSQEIGVDMWGNAVTEADMEEVRTEEKEEVPKTYRRSDFAGSEWKIGVNWRDSERIDVSWFRIKSDGTTQWGFNIGSQGQWKMDEGLYLTVSQDYLFGWNGKKLYSAKISEDLNYLEGIVRGWKPWEPASVMGRWQAVRLGVDRPNLPPWADLETRIQLEEEEKILAAAAEAAAKEREEEESKEAREDDDDADQEKSSSDDRAAAAVEKEDK